MNTFELKAVVRDEKKTNPEKLRKEGFLPAVLYGHKVTNLSLMVNAGEFEKVFRKAGESTIINLLTNDEKKHPVLIHDIQYHYLTSKPIHIDFFEVSMSEKLKAKVALEFINEAPAVKTMGGVLVKVLNEVEVQCLPVDLPHSITVDLLPLVDFQSTIHVSNLKVSDKVQILTNHDEIIAKVQPPRDVEAELATTGTDEKAAVEAVVAASTEKKEENKEDAEKSDKEEKAKK